MNMKDWFFDRAHVLAVVDKDKLKPLRKAGGSIRLTAQRSMRRRKKGFSQPGQPPFSKQGLIRDFTFFAYDKDSDSVVVGPVGFKRAIVPALHEFGGSQTVYHKGKSEVAKYPKRPYMKPALDKNINKIPEAFQDFISTSR